MLQTSSGFTFGTPRNWAC